MQFTIFLHMRILIFLFASLLCFSCKKHGDCTMNMNSIAGTFKEVKMESVAFGSSIFTDVTSTLPSCELSGVYRLSADSTFTYTEPGTCKGSGSGTWEISDSWLYLSFTSGSGTRISGTSINSWDCSSLVLLTRYPSANFNYRITLHRL